MQFIGSVGHYFAPAIDSSQIHSNAYSDNLNLQALSLKLK